MAYEEKSVRPPRGAVDYLLTAICQGVLPATASVASPERICLRPFHEA